MIECVEVTWTAHWECPECGEYCDEVNYDIDFSDSIASIECAELVDKGGDDFEVCGHKYSIRR